MDSQQTSTTTYDFVLPPLSSLPARSPSRRQSSSLSRSPRLLAQQQLESPAGMPRKLPEPQRSTSLDERALNDLEWEEERLINQLTVKLETLRADKAKLENDLEAESESMVLKLQRQLQQLSKEQQQQQSEPSLASSPYSPQSPVLRLDHLVHPAPEADSAVLLHENAVLRERLAQTEAGYVRLARHNDLMRSELLELRSRLGIDVSDLVGLASPPSTHAAAATTPGLPIRRAASASPKDARTVSFSSSTRSSQLTSSSSGSTQPSTSETTPSTSYRSPPPPFPTPSTSYAAPPPARATRAPPNSLASSFVVPQPPASPTAALRPDKVHPCDVPDRLPAFRVAESGRLMARPSGTGRPCRRSGSADGLDRDRDGLGVGEMAPVQEHSN